MSVVLVVALAFVVAAVALGGVAAAQSRSVADGVYTTAQADRGEALYDEQCVSCHGDIKQMTPEMAALLADHTFRARWSERSLGELFEMIQVEMPQDAPGSLSPPETADLLAFILRGNRRPAGEAAMPEEIEALNAIPFEFVP